MHEEEALVALVCFISFFTTVFGYVFLRSRENMALIEKGINPRRDKSMPKPFGSLKYGLLLLGCGLGLLVSFLMDNFLLDHRALTPGGEAYERDFPAIYFALIAIGGSIGLIISYKIEKKDWLEIKE